MLAVLLVLMLAIPLGLYSWISNRKLNHRIQGLEQELQRFSNVMSQMAEVQVKTFEKHSASFENLEERIMELSVPSHDSSMPLERRHQVLTLARQGVPLDDIVKRLKAPVGEAELILNLRKYMGGQHARPPKLTEQVKKHA